MTKTVRQGNCHLLLRACIAAAVFYSPYPGVTDPITITVGLSTDIPSNIANGGTFVSGDPSNTDLRGALNHVNLSPNPDGYTIQFSSAVTNPIQLGAMLPILNLVQAYPLTIDGGSHSIMIDGQNIYRGLFAHQGTINLKNLQIQNVQAPGGDGGFPGGGGGMGAGAGLFVNSTAQVFLSNVSMRSSIASGGDGMGNSSSFLDGTGGGGGLGGQGGSGTEFGGAGGGGGFGGSGGVEESNKRGGGGGINCGTNHTGTGGGTFIAAQPGGGIGGAAAGAGDSGITPGGINGGGGGQGTSVNGGGGGGIQGSSNVGSNGGAGGMFGGGGGGALGGNGGFGGGGGGGGDVTGDSGKGGFGGGGGANLAAGNGGDGGFGGGGGGSSLLNEGGSGGVGGGNGQAISFGGFGGGGAGFGGAIFVNAPGQLTILDAFNTEGNFTQAGFGFKPGWAAGDDCFFLTSSSIILDPNGKIITISNSIADDSLSSFVGIQSGTTTGTAAGAAITIGDASNAPGIVHFSANNHSTYSGLTCINQGTLLIDGSITSPSLISSGATLVINGSTSGSVTVSNNGRLQGVGTVNNQVQVNPGGTIHAGNSIGTLTLQNLILANHANVELEIDLSPNSNHSSLYLINDSIAFNESTLVLSWEENASFTPHLYQFIEYMGNASGQLNSAIVNRPVGYAASLRYLPHSVQLALTPISTILGMSTGLSSNEQKTLNYLLAFTTVPILQPIFDDLLALSPEQLKAALNSISSARNAGTTFFTNQVAFGMMGLSLSTLQQGRILHHMSQEKIRGMLGAVVETKNQNLLALAENALIPYVSKDLARSEEISQDEQKPAGKTRTAAAKPQNYSLWTTGFGDFLSQDGQHSNPKIYDTVSGAILGFDYYGYQNGIFTISAGYIHNDITAKHHVFNGTSNGGVVSIYGTGYIGNSYLESGILGGYHRFNTHRQVSIPGPSPFNAIATGSFNDWVVMPHLAGGYDWMRTWGVIEPFGSVDWAISFQRGFKENGAAPLDMKIKRQTPSILRSQVGMNLYETWDLEKHVVIFQQSASFINKVFFHTNVTSTIILPLSVIPTGAPSSFTLQSYDRTLNLGGLDVEIFYKHKKSGFFVSATYQGEFGRSYRSNDISGMIGLFF